MYHLDFLSDYFHFRNLSEIDEKVSKIMTTAWTNFAKFGDPSPPGTPFSWTPVDPNFSSRYFNISGAEPSMDLSPDIRERMQLWFAF